MNCNFSVEKCCLNSFFFFFFFFLKERNKYNLKSVCQINTKIKNKIKSKPPKAIEKNKKIKYFLLNKKRHKVKQRHSLKKKKKKGKKKEKKKKKKVG